MLRIRQTQVDALAQAQMRNFEQWMLVHLMKFFPQPCQKMGEAKALETIRHGVKRARSYGIRTQRDVCKYIDLMIVFGRDFDLDTRYSWAAEVLGSSSAPSAKVSVLLRTAKEVLGKK